MTEVPTPPSEFNLPLANVAVWAGPEGIGETPFDAPAPAEALEIEGDDPRVALRSTLGMFATGVTIITTRVGGQVHGMTANAFMSVSLEPPLVLISVDRRTKMCTLLHEGSTYGVSVLCESQSALSDRFAGRVAEGAPEPRFELVHDTPLVEGALAHLVAGVVRSYWGGDHSLFLGRVEYVRYGEGTPLLFHGGSYGRVAGNPRVFSELPPELLQPILDVGVEREYEDGEAIMRVGEAGDAMALVVEGNAVIERGGRRIPVAPGELVGEIAVLDGGPRTATVVAEGPARVLEISRADLMRVLEADPKATSALIAVLASRFRES
jgi:flavin reductase (DIM6/NTAB) family NADH-FMN oxidoreductase RutF